MVRLETQRLVLRNYKPEDFNDIKKYFASEEVSRYEDFYSMPDEQIVEIIKEWENMDNRLVVELKSEKTVIGSIGYWIDDKGRYSIDYDFNPVYGRNGYATEAGHELIRYLFSTVGISELYGDCDVRNVASWRLLERLGFCRIGQLDNQSYKDDEMGKPILISTFLYELKKVVTKL